MCKFFKLSHAVIKNVYKWDKIVNTDEQTDSHRRIPRGDRVFYLSAVGKPAKISLYVN